MAHISAQLVALELLMLTCSELKTLELPRVEWLCVRKGSMLVCLCMCIC